MGGDDLACGALGVHRDPAGDLADFDGGPTVHLGDLAQCAGESKTIVVGHHRRTRHRILAEGPREDLVAFIPGKVEVDVGRILARRIEEALEQQPGTEWLDVGDAETVGDHRVGDGAAATVGRAVAYDVLHHQEVVGEPFHPDDAEFVLEPIAGDWRDGAVATHCSFVRLRAELGEGVVGVGGTRCDGAPDGNAILAPLGQYVGGSEGLGNIGEVALEVGRGAEPGIARPGTAHLCQCGVVMNREQEAVPVPLFGVGADHATGDHGGHAEPACGGEHVMATGFGTQFGVDSGGPRELHQSFEQVDVASEHHEAGAIDGELRTQGEIRIPVNGGGSAAERGPAASIFGEHHRVVIAGDKMTAEDGADACGITGALEFDGAVDAVGVGEREGAIAAPCGGLRQHLGR